MKKSLLFIAVIAAAISVNAQGTWLATGLEESVAAGTEINLGISNLKCMHSDATGIVGKPDALATSAAYNGVTYENLAFMQGSTNGMYLAFLPSLNGTLDVSIKMGSGKKTFVLEVKDDFYTTLSSTAGNLAALTTGVGTADLITADYFTTPSVFDTYNNSTATWDGTVAIQSTGANVYMVISFPVLANKTYVVGCFGSKLMTRGVTYLAGTGVKNISASNAKVVSTQYFNIAGIQISQPVKGINIVRNTMSDGTISTSKTIIR